MGVVHYPYVSSWHNANVPSNMSDNATCVGCFFPNNCEDCNCVEGSGGDTCERCLSDYFRSGAVCLPCPPVPWSCFVGLVLLGLIAAAGSSNRFSVTVAIKVKMLVDMSQLLFLSLGLRVQWPQAISTIIDSTKFSFLNALTVNIECYADTPTAFYITWLSSVGPLTLFTVSMVIADRCMLKFSRREARDTIQEQWKQRRSVLRRFLVYIWLFTFAPVASLVVQPYACEGNIKADIWFNGSSLDSNRWAFDQSHSCSDALFQASTFVSTFILVFYIILSPLIVLFFTIRMLRFKLHRKYRLNYGSVYEAYEPSWCFMEGIIVLRKLVLIVLTDIYPIVPLVQILVSGGLSFLYFVLIICGTPYRLKAISQSDVEHAQQVRVKIQDIFLYRKTYFRVCQSRVDVHNSFEALASFTVMVNQMAALMFLYDIIADATQYILLFINGIAIVFWVMIFLGQGYLEETWVEEIGDNNDERDGESDAGQIEGEISIPFFLKKKDGISAAELRNREVAISEF